MIEWLQLERSAMSSPGLPSGKEEEMNKDLSIQHAKQKSDKVGYCIPALEDNIEITCHL